MNRHDSPASARDIIDRIRSRMPKAMLKDRSYVQRQLYRLRKAGRHKHERDILKELARLEKRLAASAAERKARALRFPEFSFPRQLPITAHSGNIIKAIQENRVVILSGETGCGKSTQIPKMCLRAGRGVAGMIACTQPRRIAAITIAHRIAFELGENLGRSVGYKIRFRDRTPPEAFIKILTDGMLLAETQSDPRLYSYDTLIIDEAHERSLNIDFLLGIARTLLETRPELKLIITSATLDVEKFTRAFPSAPVIEASGRQYPVDVEYRPAEFFSAKPDELDYVDLALEAVCYLKKKRPGDILVFMPTEQDILDTCERLEGKNYPGTTVLPLYARLPGTQQGRVYNVKGSKIVVATNVAETSLTIPGIRYVVDTGLARISQYQPGTRIQSLPISPISQSSADQRKGRCGRVEHGVCVRLYSEEDYLARPPFTPPEIMRSNLAEVILRMIDLRLGHPADFPFVDRPNPKHIKDGYDTLLELGAIDRRGKEYNLTEKGRVMARIPLDPKISRMLLEAGQEGCLREVAIIAAALSIRDPRERPPEKADQADAAQAAFRHPDSDFLILLNIWDRYHRLHQKSASKSRMRRFCREHFLSYSRMREWGHIHDQILAICEEQSVPPGRKERIEVSAGLYAGIHRSILSGYLSNIAVLKERNIYTAAKNRQVMVFPGSTLFGQSPPWIVAAETVRTSRLFARTAARIDAAWLEALGGDLCRSSYSGEHWDRERGEVVALERVTLYGLEIVSNRPVSFGRIQPEIAHQIFIQSALVEGQLNDPPAFLRQNQDLIGRLATIEEKLRRRGYLVGEEDLAEYYSRRLPGIFDERSLRKYIKDREGDDFLKLSETDLLRLFPDEEELAGFPDHLQVGEQKFPLSYRFSIGSTDDGPTLRVPLSQVSGIPENALEWGIPGQFREKIAALVKGLPKRYRKLLVPVSEKVDIIVDEMEQREESLYKILSDFVRRRFQTDIPAPAWEEADIPPHLRMRVALIGPEGKELTASRNLKSLRKKKLTSKEPPSSEQWSRVRKEWEREDITSWEMEHLPEEIPVGPYVTAYPALEPTADGANLRLFASRDEARKSHRRGVRNLLFLRFEKDLDFLRRYLVLPEDIRNLALHFGGQEAVEEALMEALQKEAFEKDIRSREELEAYAENLTKELFAISHALTEATRRIMITYHKVRMTIRDIAGDLKENKAVKNLLEEARQELDNLVPKNFLSEYPLSRLEHLPRYLDALHLRVERGRYDPAKDRAKAEQAIPFIRALQSLEEEIAKNSSFERTTEVDNFRWMVEEFKVSLFAPELKTVHPVSAKRLLAKLKALQKKD